MICVFVDASPPGGVCTEIVHVTARRSLRRGSILGLRTGHALTCSLFTLLLAMPALAEEPIPAADAASDRERIRLLEQNLATALQKIEALRGELVDLKARTAPAARPGGAQAPSQVAQPASPPQHPQGPVAASRPPPRPPAVAQAPPQPSSASTPKEGAAATPKPAPVEEEEESAGGEDEEPQVTPEFLRRASAVLLPRNTLEFDPSVSYTYTNRNNLNIRGLDILSSVFIGTIKVNKLRRSLISPSLSVRYGVTDRIQASVSIPYSFANVELFVPADVEQAVASRQTDTAFSDRGIGDINIGVAVHALRESNWLPDVVLAADVKTDTGGSPFLVDRTSYATGTGFWGVRGGMTLVRVSDPGVFFANIGYFYHIPEKNVTRALREVDPADSIDWGVGLSYSLNPFLSFSTRFSNRIGGKTSINGRPVDGTDSVSGSLQLGMTYGYARNRSFDFSLGAGLTDDSPDFTAAISAPFSFNLTPLWNGIGSWF